MISHQGVSDVPFGKYEPSDPLSHQAENAASHTVQRVMGGAGS